MVHRQPRTRSRATALDDRRGSTRHRRQLRGCLARTTSDFVGGIASSGPGETETSSEPRADAGQVATSSPNAPSEVGTPTKDAGSKDATAATCPPGGSLSTCAACCVKQLGQGCWDLALAGYQCTSGCGPAVGNLCSGNPVTDTEVSCLKSALADVCTVDPTYASCRSPNGCPAFTQCLLSCSP